MTRLSGAERSKRSTVHKRFNVLRRSINDRRRLTTRFLISSLWGTQRPEKPNLYMPLGQQSSHQARHALAISCLEKPDSSREPQYLSDVLRRFDRTGIGSCEHREHCVLAYQAVLALGHAHISQASRQPNPPNQRGESVCSGY
jgi:hypothetical protein